MTATSHNDDATREKVERATVEWAKHPGETEDGIRELAIIDRYYALDDLSAVGLGRSFDDVRKVVG